MKVGIGVCCAVCGHMKQPHGRSAPLGTYYCDGDCPGYDQDPKPGCLWPGETEEEFGFQICSNAVETVDYDGPNVPGWEGGFAENH